MRFVLDTSAIVEFLHGRSYRVAELLRQAQQQQCKVYCSFISLFELAYTTRLPPSPPEKDSLNKAQTRELLALQILQNLQNLPMSVIPEDATLRWQAAEFKATGGLSPADAYVLATAFVLGAVLVHKDQEFRRFAVVSQEEIA